MNKETTPQEQSILNIEDRAEIKRQTKYIDGSINAHTKNDWQSCYKEGFIAGANEMLPIIKELLEALKEAKPSVFQYEYGQGERYENETYTKIQTTLDKYKQYL